MGDIRCGFCRCGGGEGGAAWLGVAFVGVCEAGRWLKDASGGSGSVVVVLVVRVERRARRGRRKVGGRVVRGGEGGMRAFRMVWANICFEGGGELE